MSDEAKTTDERPTPSSAWRERRVRRSGTIVEPALLEAAVENGEIERSDVTFTAELVALADADGDVAAALFAGGLAAAVARRRGSVRFDLEGGGVDGLAGRLADLVPTLFDPSTSAGAGDTSSGDDGAGDLSTSEPYSARAVAEVLINLPNRSAAEPLVGGPDDYRPLVVDDGHLYRHRDWVEEGRLARAIAGRIEPGWRGDRWPEFAGWAQEDIERRVAELVEAFDPAPTPEQQYAIVTAATSPLSVVTGGPGTGKTSLVVSLLRLLVALGVEPERIALAAPTGKAADRLGESIGGQLVEAAEGGAGSNGDLAGQVGLFDQELPDTPEARDRRIAEELEEPATIHRLLGYSRRRRDFHHDEYRPLPYDYVVVDEASMIDLELMDRLVAAVEQDAKLVLVGDADQLPAVGSGAVFRDLVPEVVHTDTPRREVLDGEVVSSQSSEPLAAQSVELTTNFRMRPDDPAGSNVLAVARAVRDGGSAIRFSPDTTNAREEPEPVISTRSSFGDLDFGGAEVLSGPTDGWVEAWYDGPIADEILTDVDWEAPFDFDSGGPGREAARRLDDLFEAFRDYQLLGVTRRRPRGVEALDGRLHRRHVREQKLSVGGEFVVGEPVMMTKNDYERGLFNGDRGLVLRVRDVDAGESVERAVFPQRDGYAAFALGPLSPQLDRAWSITVHKAQGSEYGSVGIVLPSEPIPLATRELLYTGITRARRSVTFFGDPKLIVDAARRTDERNTGLVERVTANLS